MYRFFHWTCDEMSLHHCNPIYMSHSSLQLASCQICKIAGCACTGNAGNVFPRQRFQRKPLIGDPGMHYGTCVTHVPWCMLGSLNRGGGENVPGIPAACATRNFTYLIRGQWNERLSYYSWIAEIGKIVLWLIRTYFAPPKNISPI